MGDTRVIYLVHPSKGVTAPELMVRFRCPECAEAGAQDVELDAYQGPPVCQTHRRVLEGIAIMRPPYERHEPTPLAPGAAATLSRAAVDKGAASRVVTQEMDALLDEQTPGMTS